MPSHPLWQHIRELEQLLSADPDNVAVRQDLLRSQQRYLRLHGPDPAVGQAFDDNVEVLYALNPRDPLVSEVLAGLVDPAYRPPPPDDPLAELSLSAGWLAMEQQDLESAAEHLREALLTAPGAPAVHLACARHALLRGQADEAWGHGQFLREQHPDCVSGLVIGGENLMALGRLDEAAELLLEALSRNPLAAGAEQLLIALGYRLGFFWLKLPLRPAVWPLIGADGRSWIVQAEGIPAPVRAAWRAWAQAIVEGSRRLPPERTPLAGLPREMPLLQHAFGRLLRRWRRGRVWRRVVSRRPAHPAALTLDWLSRVAEDGLLEAYLYFSYLHPDLGPAFRAWREGAPEAMRQFLSRHVCHPGSIKESS